MTDNTKLSKIADFSTNGQRALYGLGVLVALAVLAPIAWLALSAITSIAMAAVVATGLGAVFYALPMLKRKWKNAVLKMMMAEARQNPIETLWNDYTQRLERYQQARKTFTQISALHLGVAQSLKDFKAKHNKPSESLTTLYDRLTPIIDKLKEKVFQTGRSLESYKGHIEQKAEEYEIAIKTGRLARMLKEADASSPLDALLADTAIKEIRESLNLSLGEIDDILMDSEVKSLQLPDADNSDIVDLTATEVPPPIKVGRRK